MDNLLTGLVQRKLTILARHDKAGVQDSRERDAGPITLRTVGKGTNSNRDD